jgi:soluble lytic murein transglycosylase-like protein
VASVTDSNQTPIKIDEAVWIYLVGGARVEADSANESPAGVWYKRGPLSIFIDKSRVDHIERESLGTLADAGKRPRGWSTGRPKIDALIRQNGAKYGVDPYLIFCVMEQESHFNVHALSPKGAAGLMQLMPGTAARFGVRRSFDPAQNISGGTRYLKQLMAKFNNRVDLVLASYNAGEGAVVRYGHRVPPYRETRNYVKRISFRYRQVKSPVSPSRAVGAGGF